MASAAPILRPAGIDELLAIPEQDRHHEVIDGELIRRVTPSAQHGNAQLGLGGELDAVYGIRSRGRGPGGWIFVTEVEIRFEQHQIYRPDIAGWRRERLPELPREPPVGVLPDWVCEILSPSNTQNDLIRKMRTYQRCGVPHYWILDPIAETLTVHRWTPDGSLLALAAVGRERVKPEPFGAIELSVHGLLTGDDAPEPV